MFYLPHPLRDMTLKYVFCSDPPSVLVKSTFIWLVLVICMRTHPVQASFYSPSGFPVSPASVCWNAVPRKPLVFQPGTLHLLPGKPN